MNIKSNDELLELFESADKFNSFIEKLKQEIILMIPKIVVKHIQDEHQYAKVLNNFYSKHPRLAQEKVLVSSLINKIVNDDPSMPIEQVFENVAIQVYPLLEVANDKGI